MTHKPSLPLVVLPALGAILLSSAVLPVLASPIGDSAARDSLQNQATVTSPATVEPSPTPCPTFTPEPNDFRADVQVYGSLIRGRTTPGGQVQATISDADGTVVSTAEGRAEPSGVFVLEPKNSEGQPFETEPGWRVQVSGPNGSADIQPTHLSLFIELSGGKLIGEGPPNTDMRVISSYTGGVRQVRTNDQGKFNEVWLPEREGVAGPWGELFYDLPDGNSMFVRDRILSLTVEIGSPYVKITGPPVSHLSASVEKGGPGRFLLGTVAGPASGWGEAIFGMQNQATHEDLPIVAGLRVMATSEKFPEVEHRLDPVPELSGKVAPGGKAVVGWTRSRALVRARLYWPPDPLDPCSPVFAERRDVAEGSGAFSIALESRSAGPLPRPLEDVDRLVLAHRTVWGDEVLRPISTEYGELVTWLFLPLVQRDPAH